MLKLVTKHATLDVEVNGKVCHIPLEPTLADVRRAGMVMPNAENLEAVEWFIRFLEPYMPKVEELSVADLSVLMSEWNKLRTDAGGATTGE
mgnify:FL=1|jgi:hypothetical protein